MIKVVAKKVTEAKDGGITKIVREYLAHDGLALKQYVLTQQESDYAAFGKYRISYDNGKTYGDWQEISLDDSRTFYGDDEVLDGADIQLASKVWNPVHKHYVSTYFTRYFIDGHEKAYRAAWMGASDGKQGTYDHQYIRIYKEHEEKHFKQQFMKYEDGDDFDPNNPRNVNFLTKNQGYINKPIVLKNGDIMVVVGATVEFGCRISGQDVNKVFPSRPKMHRCALMARGVYNAQKEEYEFTYSDPVILSDTQSSRGIDEPMIAELKTGRIILVMRGSNVMSDDWGTRINPYAPSFKWWSYSDDGGKTFTTPTPWHFDNREVVYSSATICELVRSIKTGKLYWIGNFTGPKTYGNGPRFPLHICEIDEETGVLKHDTLTVIDTRREGETESLQLSNFHVLQDRETGHIEVALFKNNQYDAKRPFYGEGWVYDIDLGE